MASCEQLDVRSVEQLFDDVVKPFRLLRMSANLRRQPSYVGHERRADRMRLHERSATRRNDARLVFSPQRVTHAEPTLPRRRLFQPHQLRLRRKPPRIDDVQRVLHHRRDAPEAEHSVRRERRQREAHQFPSREARVIFGGPSRRARQLVVERPRRIGDYDAERHLRFVSDSSQTTVS